VGFFLQVLLLLSLLCRCHRLVKKKEEETRDKDTSIKTTEIGGGGDEGNDTPFEISVKVDTGDCGV
jgi:hypothetical protein